MMTTSKVAGAALFVMGLAGRQAMAQVVTTCPELITAVKNAGNAAAEIQVGNDISCVNHIEISSGQDITILGSLKVMSIGSNFDSTTADSLFVNEGSLTLRSLTVDGTTETTSPDGVRGVKNSGKLTLESCTFSSLNNDVDQRLELGGAIYSDSSEDLSFSGSTFNSNLASSFGGAICAHGSGTLKVSTCTFKVNEAGTGAEKNGAGGDIYAEKGIQLIVEASTFSDSSAEYGGSAIECCGADIIGCSFTGVESSRPDGGENYGAILVGRPGVAECPRDFIISNSSFSGCSAQANGGAGGALAIFNTKSDITDCKFEGGGGSAVVFVSSDADSPHQISVKDSEFNFNVDPSEMFWSSSNQEQGTAIVVQNTGLAKDAEAVDMGNFNNLFCFSNKPYECEIVYDLALINHSNELKCQICDMDGVRQFVDDDGSLIDIDGLRDVNTGSSDASDSVVIGLSLALGLTLVVIGGLAVWKFRVRKNARRLMEDMGGGL